MFAPSRADRRWRLREWESRGAPFRNRIRGASPARRLRQACHLGASSAAGSRRDTLVAEVSEPFAYVIWNFAACFGKRLRPPALRQTRGFASRLPVYSLILQNIWDLRLPVSVEVGMREIKRTQQQPIPTYQGSYSTASAPQTWPQLRFHSQFWQSVFAFLRGSFPRIYSVVTLP